MMNLNATCHCGAVDISLAHKPEFINDCNCSLCSKTGGLWGYYNPSDVKVLGQTQAYRRTDSSSPVVEIRFCQKCGVTTHWQLTENYKRTSNTLEKMGVNMRLFDESNLTGIELRFPDGKNWFGESEYGYRKQPVIIGDETP